MSEFLGNILSINRVLAWPDMITIMDFSTERDIRIFFSFFQQSSESLLGGEGKPTRTQTSQMKEFFPDPSSVSLRGF